MDTNNLMIFIYVAFLVLWSLYNHMRLDVLQRRIERLERKEERR